MSGTLIPETLKSEAKWTLELGRMVYGGECTLILSSFTCGLVTEEEAGYTEFT
jgi:hypothetical protein